MQQQVARAAVPDRRHVLQEEEAAKAEAAVRGSGARYLLLHLDAPVHVGPRFEARRCLARLTELYGAPAEVDERLAVFDLRR